MIDLRLEYVGGGTFRCRSKLDFELCGQKLRDGEKVRAKITNQRSVKQNEFFHSLIELAWENQRAGPQLPSWRHLKSWLLIQVGHCTVKEFDPRVLGPSVASYLRQVFDTVDFTSETVGDREIIRMKVAKTVNFKEVSSEEMSEIVDKVVAIICTDIVPGSSPDEILNMAKAKAA